MLFPPYSFSPSANPPMLDPELCVEIVQRQIQKLLVPVRSAIADQRTPEDESATYDRINAQLLVAEDAEERIHDANQKIEVLNANANTELRATYEAQRDRHLLLAAKAEQVELNAHLDYLDATVGKDNVRLTRGRQADTASAKAALSCAKRLQKRKMDEVRALDDLLEELDGEKAAPKAARLEAALAWLYAMGEANELLAGRDCQCLSEFWGSPEAVIALREKLSAELGMEFE
uniref:Kinetochore protein Spc24 n=1 Tax=Mycena chlorophos TaxID=658473 RepID=A0ABQ0LBS9_MYCCL|nr:predicted protein [Mycena chlorophos]